MSGATTDIREIVARALFDNDYPREGGRKERAWAESGIEYCEMADTALQAIEQAGSAIVPVEPTDAMRWAWEDSTGGTISCSDENAYKAMLTAYKEGK